MPGTSANEPPAVASDKSPEVLLNGADIKFQIIFQGTPQARTNSVSSADLKNAAGNGTMSSVTLEAVRKIAKLPKAFLFCVNDTNTVADTTDLGHYISLTKDNITALQNAARGTSAILTLQYTSRHRPPAEIPKPPILITPPKDDGKLPEINDRAPLAVNIATTGLVAGSGQISSTHPAEMTDKQWHYIMITNSLLHGMFLDPASNTFKKARYPAFKLKASFPDPLDTDAKSAGSDSNSNSDQICIPAFEVDDNSSVTIVEVKTTYELSMAQHAFNSSSIEASASGGFGPISGGVSASASWSSSHSSASKLAKSMDILHISYNFPRVKTFLDSDDLGITDHCQRLLDTIATNKRPDDVATFYKKYGHIFATSVQLGGRLHTTKESTSSNETKYKEQKDALKVAAGASFSSPYASGSVSASHGSNSGSNSNEGSNAASEALAWEAQGGEALLGSNPTAWITSVGSYYNWRVTQRSDVHDILTLLKRISNKPDKDWPTIFSDIEGVEVNTRAKDPLVWTGPLPGDSAQEIQISNNTNAKFRVAVSKTGLGGPMFFEIHPRRSHTWKRTNAECVFINRLDSNRVVIAMAQPGKYEIENIESNDSNCQYAENSRESIGVANNTDANIQIKITAQKSGSLTFYEVRSGTTERWGRDDYETIFVKPSSSNTLFTYLGKSGYDLQVNNLSDPSSPDFNFVKSSSIVNTTTSTSTGPFSSSFSSTSVDASTKISVFNAQSNTINVKVSSTTQEEGSERFFTVKRRQQESWTRHGEEVIYVNGPHGTAVGTYYGELGHTLIADEHITNDGK